jgi:HK97 gp10 family phage protein
MDITVKVEGLDKVHRATKEVQQAIARELDVALFASAKKVEADAKKSIVSGEKSGRLYKRRTVTHRASEPGQAPASDTGRLVNSINSYLEKGKSAFVVAGRGIVNYAAHLEFGTIKMAARPFMFPALESNRAWIKERIAAAVRKAAAKSVKK